MNLDIRIPIGLLFTILGGLLAIYGVFTYSSPMYEKSLNFNINLWWGLVMLLFGALMYVLGRKQPAPEAPSSGQPAPAPKP